MTAPRPNPDELLAQVQAEETRRRAGRLKIFFGYAAGVGKTFAMLQAGHRELAAGVDVVVGYVELHGRRETEALLEGLEVLPCQCHEHRGVTLKELDLDAVLRRRPQLVLIDELAHTNAPGARHVKRWQDVQELLDAGLDVFTSLNVQHLESLKDLISQITNVEVRETLPDFVFERADEIELIDITPEELCDRLKAGKVYLPAQAERALQRFFQRPNLVALRELSLREAAARINDEVQRAHATASPRLTWPTAERLLVCVGPSPTSGKLIRSAKRLADSLRADWIAVTVEPLNEDSLSSLDRHRIAEHLKLAESLGAEIATVTGRNVAEEVIAYARSRNVSKLVVGKTGLSGWLSWRRSINDKLLRHSGEIDVYVIRGERDSHELFESRVSALQARWHKPLGSRLSGIMTALAATMVATLIGFAMTAASFSEANIVMVFLLSVVVVSARFGREAGVVASVLGVLAFDVFFVPPRFSLAVADSQYVVTFLVMLLNALLTSGLMARVREQADSARRREQRTGTLLRLSRQLAGISGLDFLLATAGRQLLEITDASVMMLLPDEGGRLTVSWHGIPRTAMATADHDGGQASHQVAQALSPHEFAVAQWVYEHNQLAGAGTETLPNVTALFVPLTASQGAVGVLGIRTHDSDSGLSPDERQFVEACASLTALALERDHSTLQAARTQIEVESERLRSALLSSVSHDLRTPLAVIAGMGGNLLEHDVDIDTRHEMLQTIVDESLCLGRLVDNLLDMTRVDAGALELHQQWQVVEEIVGSALHRMHRLLANRVVTTRVPTDLPLVRFDGALVEQVLINLLDNAVRYTPAGTPIEISAQLREQSLQLEVRDHGPGVPPGAESLIFQKFYRGANTVTDGRRGTGLGLTICRAIILAHGGQIGVENSSEGGARFWFTLPQNEPVPLMPT